MPGPLPHALYAVEYLKAHPKRDRRRFIRGAEFSDIRRLAELPREATHRSGATLEAVEYEANDWRAGLLLHNQLDDAWNEFFYQFGLAFARPADELTWLALKIAEDQQLSEGLNSSQKHEFAAIFDGKPEPEELELTVQAKVTAWDEWLKWKLSQSMMPEDWIQRFQELGYTREIAQNLKSLSQQIGDDPQWQHRFDELHQQFGYGLS